MNLRRERNLTPLPKVNEQSSRIGIAIDSLALPVGLEPSWIGVNVPVFERAASLVGTEYVVVMGRNGEQDDVQVAGSMGEDGSLASSAASVARKQRGDFRSLSFRDGDLNDFATIIKLNNATRKADSGDIANQYDPYVQADLLDQAIRKQLMRASVRSNTNRGNHALDSIVDGAKAMFAVQATMLDFLATPTGKIMAGGHAAIIGMRGLIRLNKSVESGVEAQHSMFNSFKVDRIALGLAYIATHRIVGVPEYRQTDVDSGSQYNFEAES